MRKLLRRCLCAQAAAVLVCLTPAASGAQTAQGAHPLGDASVGSQLGSLKPGRSEAFRFRAQQSGVARQVYLYLDSRNAARTILAGLYGDANGHPGRLLSAGSASAPSTAAWSSVSIGPVPLVAGRPYWLAVLGNGGTLGYRHARGRRCVNEKSRRRGLRSLPLRWRGARSQAGCPISAYAAGAIPSPTVPLGGSAGAGPFAPLGPGSSPSSGVSPPVPIDPSVPIAPPASVAPVNTVAPAIQGTALQGEILNASAGSWTAGPTSYAYQWQDCNAAGGGCANIGGATATAHTLGPLDLGQTLRVVVTASNAAGSTSARSEASSLVTAPTKAPPPSPACTTQLSSVSAVASLAASAAPGSAVCLTAGSYGQLELSGSHVGNVTVESVPGSAVSLAGVKVAAGASNLTIHNFATKEINLAPGASNITIDHNDISGGGDGIVNSSVNCSSPNSPTYAGCTSTAPNSYITINGNKIHGYGDGEGEDAIHLSNWEHIAITANELYDLEERGNHTDAFQSVFGGSNLSFDHNYEHDNQSQGFFIKDGDAANVALSDNLFLRNDNLGKGENNIQVFNTAGFTMTNNTAWDGQGDLIRAENSAQPLTAAVNHNVEQLFSVLHESGPAYTLTEDYDIFKEQPLFAKGPHSAVIAKPAFVNPSGDDYRLASNPNKIGVDWAPSEYIYGPTGY